MSGRGEAVRWRRVLAGGLVVVMLAAGLWAEHRLRAHHRGYGVWSWSVRSPTPMITFRDRRYRRGGPFAVPPEWLRIGRTPDGAAILGPAGTELVPTAVVVQVQSRVVPYALVGGP